MEVQIGLTLGSFGHRIDFDENSRHTEGDERNSRANQRRFQLSNCKLNDRE